MQDALLSTSKSAFPCISVIQVKSLKHIVFGVSMIHAYEGELFRRKSGQKLDETADLL